MGPEEGMICWKFACLYERLTMDDLRDRSPPRSSIMSDTSISLLERLKDPTDSVVWQRLVELYTPLIRHWLRRQDLQECELDDLTQDILSVVVRKVPHFQHNAEVGAFRSGLRQITPISLR